MNEFKSKVQSPKNRKTYKKFAAFTPFNAKRWERFAVRNIFLATIHPIFYIKFATKLDLSEKRFNCSDPTFSGLRNYILNLVFFVQTIFADRYNHRRELWAVSFESPSSVEYGIKNIFFILCFYREFSRFKFLWREEDIPLLFIHFFRIFEQIFFNFAKIWWNSYR